MACGCLSVPASASPNYCGKLKMPPVLVDAGPLAALIDRNDQYHEEFREALVSIRRPQPTHMLLGALPVLPVLLGAVFSEAAEGCASGTI